LNVRLRLSSVSMTAFLAVGLCLVPAAHGAEHLTLANGFDLVCDHHALVEGRVRVYPKPAAEDYFELAPDAIRGVEIVPDPPEAHADTDTAPLKTPAAIIDTRLTAADLHQLLSKAGSEHNVDADLLASVVKAESGGNARATSRAGARGLMQPKEEKEKEINNSKRIEGQMIVRSDRLLREEKKA